VSEADFRFGALPGDFESDFSALPLAFVFGEVKVVVQDKPDHFFVRNDFD
jgi:hypothetical protein